MISLQKMGFTILFDIEYYNINSTNRIIREITENEIRHYYNAGTDILVYGYYYVYDEKIYISINAFDLINRNSKFIQTYIGKGGLDIFDTIDSIVESLQKDLAEAVPPMDDEARILYRTRMVYVSDEIHIQRAFYTSWGIRSFIYEGFNWVPVLGFNAIFKRFGFGIAFFIPGVVNERISDDLDNALAGLELWFNFNPKLSVIAGIHLGYSAGIEYDPYSDESWSKVGMLCPYIKTKYSIISNWNVFWGMNFSFMNSEFMSLMFETQFFPFQNWGASLGFDWTIPLGETKFDGGNHKISFNIIYRVNFE